jgi:hypothetical protein
MKIKLASSIFLFVLLFSGCKKSSAGWEKASIQDLTGLDGCGKVIQLEDQSYLEPVNLPEFSNSATLVDDQKVWIKYQEVSGGSICMVGKIIEIKDLKNQ